MLETSVMFQAVGDGEIRNDPCYLGVRGRYNKIQNIDNILRWNNVYGSWLSYAEYLNRSLNKEQGICQVVGVRKYVSNQTKSSL